MAAVRREGRRDGKRHRDTLACIAPLWLVVFRLESLREQMSSQFKVTSRVTRGVVVNSRERRGGGFVRGLEGTRGLEKRRDEMGEERGTSKDEERRERSA